MSAKDIRNIVLLGHSGSGKTTLAERMLFLTGGTDRPGRIADAARRAFRWPWLLWNMIAARSTCSTFPAALISPVRLRRLFRPPMPPSSSARPRPV